MLSVISTLILQSTTQKGHTIAIAQARGILVRITQGRILRRRTNALSTRTREQLYYMGIGMPSLEKGAREG